MGPEIASKAFNIEWKKKKYIRITTKLFIYYIHWLLIKVHK